MTIAEQINRNIEQFTPSERRVALTLLAYYPLAGLETVAAFAKRAGVSSPTVLRFLLQMGFRSYPDFQRILRDELDAQLKSPLMKSSSRAVQGEAQKETEFDGFASSLLDNLAGTLEHLPARELNKITALLSNTRAKVYLRGGRFTDSIAQYMATHLRILRPGVTHLAGPYEHWRDELLNLRKNDVLVIFDVRRYQENVVDFAGQASARGAKVVLITDQWLSPAMRFASHMLSVRIEVPSNWDSNVATLALVELLLASVTTKLWPTAKKRIEQIENLRKPAKSGRDVTA